MLESELLSCMEERVVKNFLDMIILMKLRNSSISGYDVTGFIHRKFGLLISSGTLHSHLHYLERNDLVEVKWAQRKRVYELTEKGRETAQAFLDLKQKILGLIVNLFIGE